jgi:hypothetical protein
MRRGAELFGGKISPPRLVKHEARKSEKEDELPGRAKLLDGGKILIGYEISAVRPLSDRRGYGPSVFNLTIRGEVPHPRASRALNRATVRRGPRAGFEIGDPGGRDSNGRAGEKLWAMSNG